MEKVLSANDHLQSMRILSVTGGKGGIGKTTISINLAVEFAKQKKRVLLFDADLGLANVDLLLGMRAEKSIYNVLKGECTLAEVCITGPHGLKIIPSASGIQKMAELTPAESRMLIQSFSSLTDDIDIMIIDLASGISSQVIDFTTASQDIVIVICDDPASLMDGYAVVKILNQKYARSRFGIIANKVQGPSEGYALFEKFQEATMKFINLSMHYLGSVPGDDFIKMSSLERVACVDRYPRSAAAQSVNQISKNVLNWNSDGIVSGGIHFFFEKLITSSLKEQTCKV